VEFRECARDVRTWSAAKKHTNKEQGGSHDPGVRRPGAGRGQLPARSKIFRAAMHTFFFLSTETCESSSTRAHNQGLSPAVSFFSVLVVYPVKIWMPKSVSP